MPLVPLYDPNPADGSHHVRAPGGYETWRLWAYDLKQDFLLIKSLWNGYPLDPDYAKAYRRYRRNPTRVAPPVPGDFACSLYAHKFSGMGLWSQISRVPQITSFPQALAQKLEFPGLAHNIVVQPLASSQTLRLTTLNSSHHWNLISSLSRVEMESLKDPRVREFRSEALGFMDHRYGTSPLNSNSFIDGCAFFPSGIIVFQATPTTSWIVHLSEMATTLIDQPLDFYPRRREFRREDLPKTIALGDRANLSNPKLLDSAVEGGLVSYEAQSGKESGRAFCNVYPRITWPLLYFLPRLR